MMDVKPQRPLRPLKVHNENLPPIADQGKILHHRNKSTSALPTLSTLVQNGGARNGTKRTAFADISNVTKGSQLAKDDLLLAGKTYDPTKPMVDRIAKPIAPRQNSYPLEESKTTALSKPAHRPLSVAGLRGILSNVTNAVTHSSSHKFTTNNTQEETNIRKPRNASIGGDKITSIAEELSTTVPPHGCMDSSEGPPDGTVAEQGRKSQLPIKHMVPSADTIENSVAVQTSSTTQRDLTRTTSEDDYHDTYLHLIDENRHEPALEYATDFEPVQTYDSRLLSDAGLLHCDKDVVGDYIAQIMSRQELEDETEEEEDDYYEADGYTTARSLRSRGDNTTGGVTVVLAPRMTAKVQRELVDAKTKMQEAKVSDEFAEESWDTSMVTQYGPEIFAYMGELEERMRPNPHYMDCQNEIQWSMRSVLMDWIVQVHHRFGLLPETLFLTVNYVDRFLSCKVVSLGKLQLVGATAIFIAAKYEEINCPSISEIVYMVDGGYTTDEILKAERFMLTMLQFELGWPGPMSFLRRISKADDYDLETRTLAKYFLEITIMDERFVSCVPSFTAAGAHCLALLMLRKGDWTVAHTYYSGYTFSQLRPLLSVMLECCENPTKHHGAVYTKYSDKRYKRAALYVEGEMANGFQLRKRKRQSSASLSARMSVGRFSGTIPSSTDKAIGVC